MINLSPASLDVYRRAIVPAEPGAILNPMDIRAISDVIMPELEKDIRLGRRFVLEFMDNHYPILIKYGCFDKTNLLNDAILYDFEGFSYTSIKKLYSFGTYFNLSDAAAVKLMEKALSSNPVQTLAVSSSSCFAQRINTGDSNYDNDLRIRIIRRFKEESSKRGVEQANRKTLTFFHFDKVYTHADFTFFKKDFEHALHLTIGITGVPIASQAGNVKNEGFRKWAIKYIEGFYREEVMKRNSAFSQNPIISMILAHNITLVSEEVYSHANDSLKVKQAIPLSLYFIRSLVTGGWIEETEKLHDLHEIQRNANLPQQKIFDTHLEPEPFEEWMIKKEGFSFNNTPAAWRNLSPAVEKLIILKGYRKYLNEPEIQILKEDVYGFLCDKYGFENQGFTGSTEVLVSLMETYLKTRDALPEEKELSNG